MIVVMEEFFEAQEKRTLARLRQTSTRKGTRHYDYGERFDSTLEKKQLDAKRVFPPGEEVRAVDASGIPDEIERIYAEFGDDVAAQLGVAFNLQDPKVSAAIAERVNLVKGANATTFEAIQKALIDGEIAGEGIEALARRIEGVFDQAKGFRARMIARTETIASANRASFLSAEQSGVVSKKIWLAAIDGRTRDHHVLADGQERLLAGKFDVGGEQLDHPGDGGPANSINCRCTMLFRRSDPTVEGDSTLTPTGEPGEVLP